MRKVNFRNFLTQKIFQKNSGAEKIHKTCSFTTPKILQGRFREIKNNLKKVSKKSPTDVFEVCESFKTSREVLKVNNGYASRQAIIYLSFGFFFLKIDKLVRGKKLKVKNQIRFIVISVFLYKKETSYQ